MAEHYRTETLDLKKTWARDDVFIDFRTEKRYGKNGDEKKFDYNWDVDNWKPDDIHPRMFEYNKYADGTKMNGGSETGMTLTADGQNLAADLSNVDPNYIGFMYRIHALINVGYAYTIRGERGTDAPDILYAKIESEPMNDGDGLKPDGTKKISNRSSSVHQLVININADNTAANKRPIFFFYDGPEDFNRELRDPLDPDPNFGKDDSNPDPNFRRDSKPVILNLNADFNGALFVPNSAVAINGNQKNFKGFVVAKEFVQTKKQGDFYSEIDEEDGTMHYYESSSKITEYWRIADPNNVNNDRFIDKFGNVQYKPLDAGSTQTAPSSGDAAWHTDDLMYNVSAFNLKSSTYNSFNKVALTNYANWDTGLADNFFLTNRSDWVD